MKGSTDAYIPVCCPKDKVAYVVWIPKDINEEMTAFITSGGMTTTEFIAEAVYVYGVLQKEIADGNGVYTAKPDGELPDGGLRLVGTDCTHLFKAIPGRKLGQEENE